MVSGILLDIRAPDEVAGPPASADLPAYWDRLSREAARAGRGADLHASRDDFEAVVRARLRMLDAGAELADRLGPAGAADPLRAECGALQTLHDRLFPRWRTEDDLYTILVEQLSLPNEKLLELAAAYPAPQSWWDETVDPRLPAD